MSDNKHKPQSIARESAIKVLYQMKMNDNSLDDVLLGFVEKRSYDKFLMESILNKYIDNKNEIIDLLKKKTDISFDSMPLLDQCIIHLSICEYMFINNSKNINLNCVL